MARTPSGNCPSAFVSKNETAPVAINIVTVVRISFLKALLPFYNSSVVMDSFFEVREVFGRIFELLDKVVFSSEIFASFKLDILCVGLLSYSVPSLLIFI